MQWSKALTSARKAGVAAIIAGAAAVTAQATSAGGMTSAGWIVAIAAVVTAYGGVYSVTNKPSTVASSTMGGASGR